MMPPNMGIILAAVGCLCVVLVAAVGGYLWYTGKSDDHRGHRKGGRGHGGGGGGKWGKKRMVGQPWQQATSAGHRRPATTVLRVGQTQQFSVPASD